MTENSPVTFKDLLYAVCKHKYHILTILVVTMTFSLGYCLLATPVYNAKTSLLVQMGREKLSSINAVANEQFNVMFQERTQNINNEIQMLKSPYLTQLVFSKLKGLLLESEQGRQLSLFLTVKKYLKSVAKHVKELLKAPLYWIGLSEKLSDAETLSLQFQEAKYVEFIEESDVIELNFEWSNPGFAAKAANAFAQAYLQMHANVYKDRDSFDFYTRQIKLYKQKLDQIEKEILQFQDTHKIANIPRQKEILLSELSDMENRQRNIFISQNKTNVNIASIKEMASARNAWVETPNIGSLGVSFTDLSRLDQKYFNLKAQRDALLETFMPASKEVRRVNEQMSKLRRQKADSLLNILSAESNVLQSQNQIINRNIHKKRQMLEALNDIETRLDQLLRSKSIIRDNYLLYSKKAEELRISSDLDKSKILSVKVITPAVPPLRPIYPKKWLVLGLSAFLALFFGFFFSIIREYFNETFRDSRQFEQELNLPLLATIPENSAFRR